MQIEEKQIVINGQNIILRSPKKQDGSREMIEKKKNGSSKASSNVFARLLAAGQRLLEVINKCEGLPNKELAKFADQINALCDKWSR